MKNNKKLLNKFDLMRRILSIIHNNKLCNHVKFNAIVHVINEQFELDSNLSLHNFGYRERWSEDFTPSLSGDEEKGEECLLQIKL